MIRIIPTVCCIKTLTDLMTFVDICIYFPLYSHIRCLVAVCKPFIKLLLTYLLILKLAGLPQEDMDDYHYKHCSTW